MLSLNSLARMSSGQLKKQQITEAFESKQMGEKGAERQPCLQFASMNSPQIDTRWFCQPKTLALSVELHLCF